MKSRVSIIFIVFALSLIACTKTPSNTDKVFIRIENATGKNFSNFALNTFEFGSIPGGDTSKYVVCRDVLPVPFANFIAVNDTAVYIADIAPTPYLDNGNYILKVVSDTLPWRYKADFIKE